jgi:hypothetical protein
MPANQAEWPLAATNESTKFRSQVIFDSVVSAGDSVKYTAESFSEVVGRPDAFKAMMLFTEISGATPTLSTTYETSFDGIHYTVISAAGPSLISTTPFMAGSYSTVFTRPSALLRGSLQMNSGSAHIKIWVTSLMRGRRRFGIMCLDRVLVGTIPYYSESEYDEMIGAVDQLSVLVLADQEQSAASITVALEESPDGIDWVTKTILVNAVNFPIPNGLIAEDNGSTPASKFVRVRVTLTAAGGGNPSANVRVYVVGRGR